MSEGLGNWATSASRPYFLKRPWSWASCTGEKAAATWEKATLMGTSSGRATVDDAAGAVGLAPLVPPPGAAGAAALPPTEGPALEVVFRAHAMAASRTTATRTGSPGRSRAIMMPLLY